MADDLIKQVMAELTKDGKPVGMMQCNNCGLVVAYHPTNVTVEEFQKNSKDTIMKMKEHFTEYGWKTSWGYDMCPECAKTQTGTNKKPLKSKEIYGSRKDWHLSPHHT